MVWPGISAVLIQDKTGIVLIIDGYVCPLLLTKPNPPCAGLEHITYPIQNF